MTLNSLRKFFFNFFFKFSCNISQQKNIESPLKNFSFTLQKKSKTSKLSSLSTPSHFLSFPVYFFNQLCANFKLHIGVKFFLALSHVPSFSLLQSTMSIYVQAIYKKSYTQAHRRAKNKLEVFFMNETSIKLKLMTAAAKESERCTQPRS